MNLFRKISLFILIPISACSYNANVFLTSKEKAILENDICMGPPVIFENNPVNSDVVLRWKELCPNRDIGVSDNKSIKAPVVTASDSFQGEKQKVNANSPGFGTFCAKDPLLQSATLFIIPLICNFKDNFGPCLKIGARKECVTPPVKGESVEYIGWIPILTHGIPHAIGSLWSDRMEDKIIAAIQKELNQFK